MSKDHINQSRDSRPVLAPEIRTHSEAITSESSARPPNKIHRFLRKVRDGVLIKKIVQNAPSVVEQGTDSQSVDTAIRNARDAVDQMNTRLGPAGLVASVGQNGLVDLNKADNFEATYLEPLKIFDSVIGTLANVHPYAKMALGVLSCASKIVLAQVYRDEAVLSLLQKLGQVYGFMTEDKMLHQISSMHTILGQVSQQTLECAHFIRDYSETKRFWERLKKNVLSETNDTIQRYSDALDALMQNARDRIIRDVAIVVHRTNDELNLSGINYAAGAGLDSRKRCLPGTRTDILSKIMEWINDSRDDVPRVLWLSGPAGTGKSAIAHTIASSFIGVGGTWFLLLLRSKYRPSP
ncbi:hypothetical protein DFJ58DRAFT_97924 [Suillus subalutaceus]|uniref:uncharacterized protein n=1 Tax=Suillus subalutaceus TaxID=48586 RepID=UPI001B87748D|nr:uncharacterized protein DFJ58DRAFT_97924 [Suillus subalutaceus]KAG1868266.1 hypothetical protein DFJ58DRAFT_97924 [Suillus subalutaceus]